MVHVNKPVSGFSMMKTSFEFCLTTNQLILPSSSDRFTHSQFVREHLRSHKWHCSWKYSFHRQVPLCFSTSYLYPCFTHSFRHEFYVGLFGREATSGLYTLSTRMAAVFGKRSQRTISSSVQCPKDDIRRQIYHQTMSDTFKLHQIASASPDLRWIISWTVIRWVYQRECL